MPGRSTLLTRKAAPKALDETLEKSLATKSLVEDKINLILAAMMKDVDDAFESGQIEETGNPWGNCTVCAEHVIELIGHGDIFGYSKENNPTAVLADGDGEGGHDFAIIDNWIVDPWAADYKGTPGRIALSDTAQITKLYGDPQLWEKREGSGDNFTRLPFGQGLPPALQKTASPMPAETADKPYYHGNSNEKASQSILATGIQPRQISMPDKVNDKGHLAPAQGRVYLTPDFTFAAIHALGANMFGSEWYTKYNIGPTKDQNPYGYIFEVMGKDIQGDVVPDEDSIGGFVSSLLNMDKAEKRYYEITKNKSPLKYPGEATELSNDIQYAAQDPINAPGTPESVRNEIRWAAERSMTQKQKDKILCHDITGQAMVGKKMQKLLSPATNKWMLDNGAHLAHLGAVYPVRAWRFKKADAEKIKREDVMSICEEVPMQQRKAASVARKTGDWARAQDLRNGDTLAFPGPVMKVRSIHREGDELIVLGGPGVIRRFDPNDEVNLLRKTAAVALSDDLTYKLIPTGNTSNDTTVVVALDRNANVAEEAKYLKSIYGIDQKDLPEGFVPNNIVGRVEFYKTYRGADWEEYYKGENLFVDPAYRRKGTATGMYATFEADTGIKVEPATAQSELGKKFWESRTAAETDAPVENDPKQVENEPEEEQPVEKSITDTPAFKSWFGNSKVVDASGKPLVVFHGSPHEFKSDQFQVGGGGRGSIESFGFHFGPSEAANERLEKGMQKYDAHHYNWNVMPVYLSISNPLRMPDVGDWQNLKRVGRHLVNNGIAKDQVDTALAKSNHKARINALAKVMMAAGYDGIVYHNEHEGGGDSWIALDPRQIKSAIGNDGGFDPTSKKLTASTKTATVTAVHNFPTFEALMQEHGGVDGLNANWEMEFENEEDAFEDLQERYQVEVDTFNSHQFPLTVYRAITVLPNQQVNYSSTGIFWSISQDGADAYEGHSFGKGAKLVILKAQVLHPDDVDWDNTLVANLVNESEYEIRVYPGTEMKLVAVDAEKGWVPDSRTITASSNGRTAAIAPSDRTFYHGTDSEKEFKQLKPQKGGDPVIWLGEYDTAKDLYSRTLYGKGRSRVYEVQLKSDAKLADLTDRNDPFRKIFLQHFLDQKKGWDLPAAEEYIGTFTAVHANERWVKKALRILGYVGVIVLDRAKQVGGKVRGHHSVALFDTSAIMSQDELPMGQTQVAKLLLPYHN